MFKKFFVYGLIIALSMIALDQLSAGLREQAPIPVEVETPAAETIVALTLDLDLDPSNWVLEVNQDLVSNLGKMAKQGCTADWTDANEKSIPVVFTNMIQTYSSVSISQDEVLLLELRNKDVLVLTQLESGNVGYLINHPLEQACK